MNNNLPISQMLQPMYMTQLNDLVYTSTGCFIFLTTPKDPFFHMPSPKTYRECYVFNVLNLYKAYYDFSGKCFLWICLQDKQLPSVPDENAPSDFRERVATLRYERSDVLKHYDFIKSGARHILAHGIYYDISVDNYVDPKIEEFVNWCKGIIGKYPPSSDEDWKALSERISSDSNKLFSWIKEWALLWKHCNKTKKAMKDRFYHGEWKTSTKKCTLQKDKRIRDINGSDPYILYPCGYCKSEDSISSFEKAFSEQLVRDSCRKIAALAGPNVEVAPKGVIYKWNSGYPENNLPSLCGVINFFGIDRVKEELLDKTPSKCPDIYQIYLNGLFQAATHLRKKSTVKPSSAYFDKSRRRKR